MWARLAKYHEGDDRWYLEALGISADGQWDRFMDAWLKQVDGNWNTPGGRDLIWRSRGSKTAAWLSAIVADGSTRQEELPRYFRAMDFLSEADRQQLATQLAFNTQGDEQRTKYVAIESIRRLSPASISGKPEYKDALNKTLNDIEGTAEFVNLVDKFDLEDRYAQLLQLAENDPCRLVEPSHQGAQRPSALLERGR